VLLLVGMPVEGGVPSARRNFLEIDAETLAPAELSQGAVDPAELLPRTNRSRRFLDAKQLVRTRLLALFGSRTFLLNGDRYVSS
jgi:hypothetical protein